MDTIDCGGTAAPKVFSGQVAAPESIRLLICKRESYIDTVKVYVDRPLTDSDVAEVERLSGKVRVLNPMRFQSAIWPGGMMIHQPSKSALEFVDSNFKHILVCRVDVSLDLITATKVDASDVQAYLDKHLVQKWHKKQVARKFNGTTYSRRAKGSRNLYAVYSDKVSKCNGLPCCHIDWRILKAPAVRAAGLDRLSCLLNIDAQSFWERRISLRDFPSDIVSTRKLGLSICLQPKRKGLWLKHYRRDLKIDWPLRVASTHMRATIGHRNSTESGEGAMKAQELIDELGRYSDRHFPKISASWMLPEAGTVCLLHD